MIRLLHISTLILLFLSACRREEYVMDYGEMQIAVEGWIEEGEGARVLLSRSVPISELVDSSNFIVYAIRSAMVIVSDGVENDTLRLRSASQYLPPFLYMGDKVIGQTGGTYNLTIHYVNPTDLTRQTLTATTTIQPSVPIKHVEYVREKSTDTTGKLRVDFTHPNDQHNYYQVATMIRGVDDIFVPCLYSNFNSQNFTSSDVQLNIVRGVSIYPKVNFDLHYHDGDTISVRLRTMTKEGFDFWNLWQNEIINAQNPIFPANTSLKSNINGGIGIWCGYGQSTMRVIAR
ncbi:MAG: DUF4249 domain-containing protein [Bacteroidales bacterium]|nr:DUF4249 domain-containing protein [Bacteroidales bacterium]